MPAASGPVVIDGRMIFREQCHGIARVTIEMIRHLPPDRDREVLLLLPDHGDTRFGVEDLGGSVRLLHTTSPI